MAWTSSCCYCLAFYRCIISQFYSSVDFVRCDKVFSICVCDSVLPSFYDFVTSKLFYCFHIVGCDEVQVSYNRNQSDVLDMLSSKFCGLYL